VWGINQPGGLNRDRIRCVPWFSHFCCLSGRVGFCLWDFPFSFLPPLIAISLRLSGAGAMRLGHLGCWVDQDLPRQSNQGRELRAKTYQIKFSPTKI
jgi:hypothetical protein